MISSIHVRGLKRFKDETINLGPLSVLTGFNGSGKTSLMQAILMARQCSVVDDTTLALNGANGMELGTAGEVLNRDSESPIAISVDHSQGETARWELAIPTEESLYLSIVQRPANPPSAFSGRPRSFTFLSAERLGPRGNSTTSPLPQDELEVGRQGEYCAHVLSVLGDRPAMYRERAHPSYEATNPRLLKYEVEAWLSEISRKIEVTGERLRDSIVAELRYRTPGTQWVRATNMGFGITYALPIILGGLIAEKGGLLLVENPEAHLHPSGQSRMGVFLAWLAGKGVQVVVETHSDHILNGVRRAIAEHKYLDASQTAVHYFGNQDDEADTPEFIPLEISSEGSVSSWPRGFFDQFQIDVASLGQIRRKRI